MKIPKDFTEETIEIQTTRGLEKISAWVKRPFAIHPLQTTTGASDDILVVTHLPTGLSLANAYMAFFERNDAVRAVRAIAKIADWNFTRAEITKDFAADLRTKVREIALKYDGLDWYAGGNKTEVDTKIRLNGYARAA